MHSPGSTLRRFTPWQPWTQRSKMADIRYPGVYVIAHAGDSLAHRPFSWRKEIIYIGMTNADAGLRGRLLQFDNTIRGKTGHGGADRVRYAYRDYRKLKGRLYAAVCIFKCNVASNKPSDLRIMGEVAEFEYRCLATFAEKFHKLPRFNDKKGSPKYSLTVGRKRHLRASA